ncbi:MAG: Gfo/Idh/MocA family oxidoreductase [Chthonomonas sp.]|nr:Gfo/Idh/MocA family oxidoreductase [Chthonomonas sp.]
MAKKLKIGLIGAGGIAQMAHMPGYQTASDMCEMVAAADPNPATLAIAKEKFGIERHYSDYHEMLEKEQLDAVSVTTPNVFHRQPTLDALRAGCHVMCEKPLAMNAEEGKEMCRVAREQGKLLQVGLQSRFSAPARFLKNFIDHGHMGDIQYARAKALRRRGVPHWGVFIDKEKQGGGPLIDIGVHILDLTLFMMGYPKPTVATGRTWNTLGTNPEIRNMWGDYDRSKFTVEDFAVGMVRFENGAVVTLESSFMANMEGDPFESQLFGTKAGATIRVWDKENPLKIFKEVDQQYFDMTPVGMQSVESMHWDSVKSFVQAIHDGTPSPVPGEQALVLNAVFDALYKSSETGHEVPVDVSF